MPTEINPGALKADALNVQRSAAAANSRRISKNFSLYTIQKDGVGALETIAATAA